MAKKTTTNAPAANAPASSAPAADKPAAESTPAGDEPADAPQDAPTGAQDAAADTAPADATGTEDAAQAAKDAKLDKVLDERPPVRAVTYYRTDRYSRFCKDGAIYPLVANSLVTSLTHDIAELKAQGVPLVQVPDETTELDLGANQPHRHHGVV